jgi:hypothetical protein
MCFATHCKTRRWVCLGAFTLVSVIYSELHICVATYCITLQQIAEARLADELASVPLLWWEWYAVIYTCVSQRTATHCNTLQDSQMSLPWCLYSGEHDTQCVAVCCSVLQCVAVCCSVLQCVAVCCSMLQVWAWYTVIYTCASRHTRRWVCLGVFILVRVIAGRAVYQKVIVIFPPLTWPRRKLFLARGLPDVWGTLGPIWIYLLTCTTLSINLGGFTKCVAVCCNVWQCISVCHT